jgi:hypothetical protein
VKDVEGAETLLKDPPVPDTTDHVPVPAAGVLAVMATVAPQKFLSVPAFAVVGAALKVMSTSSVDAVHGVFEMVQRKV